MAIQEILEILSAGILTTIQDLGRYGYGRYGVAPSGALDSFSLRIANLLVGNAEDAACLESTLMGLRIKALSDIVIAVTGADLQPQQNIRPLQMWRSHVLKKEDVLSLKRPLSGFRASIAVGGGVHVSAVMGSRSTNLPSGFGGFEGRPLKKGDVLCADLPADHRKNAERKFNPEWIPVYTDKWVLRVVWGPQDDHFTETGRDAFLNSSFSMSPDSDRTGIRLQGPAIQRRADIEASIISEGVISGAIQIPGDGQPIIILAETVTGGYRKIATVISADLPKLGQIKPGDQVQFRAVSLDESLHALQAMEAKIRRFKTSLSL